MENDKINVTITPSQISDLREDGYSDAEIISAFFQSWNVFNRLKSLAAGYVCGLALHGYVDGEVFKDIAIKAMNEGNARFAQEAYGALVNALYWQDERNSTHELDLMRSKLADFITALCSSEIQNAELYKR